MIPVSEASPTIYQGQSAYPGTGYRLLRVATAPTRASRLAGRYDTRPRSLCASMTASLR